MIEQLTQLKHERCDPAAVDFVQCASALSGVALTPTSCTA
jgi:hypothetical protein